MSILTPYTYLIPEIAVKGLVEVGGGPYGNDEIIGIGKSATDAIIDAAEVEGYENISRDIGAYDDVDMFGQSGKKYRELYMYTFTGLEILRAIYHVDCADGITLERILTTDPQRELLGEYVYKLSDAIYELNVMNGYEDEIPGCSYFDLYAADNSDAELREEVTNIFAAFNHGYRKRRQYSLYICTFAGKTIEDAISTMINECDVSVSGLINLKPNKIPKRFIEYPDPAKTNDKNVYLSIPCEILNNAIIAGMFYEDLIEEWNTYNNLTYYNDLIDDLNSVLDISDDAHKAEEKENVGGDIR